MGDRLAARVDLKSDRQNNRLLVLGAYLEPWADAEAVAPAVAAELHNLAAWLRARRSPRWPAGEVGRAAQERHAVTPRGPGRRFVELTPHFVFSSCHERLTRFAAGRIPWIMGWRSPEPHSHYG